MNFLGNLIAILIILIGFAWGSSPELRCEAAQRQIQAYDMCRIMDECDVDKEDISWYLWYEKIAEEDCE